MSNKTPPAAPADPIYTQDQAAEYLDVAPRTLANWRSKGEGPVFLKVGANVRYRKSQLDTFLDACEVA